MGGTFGLFSSFETTFGSTPATPSNIGQRGRAGGGVKPGTLDESWGPTSSVEFTLGNRRRRRPLPLCPTGYTFDTEDVGAFRTFSSRS